ncbi:MAG: N-acetylglutamate synthase-like GNAT family acetyltransferase [Granulosicoccus sp.]|jgi:N-acetylglutamate synthase-like GNAT family acetyltransferase
MEKSFIIETLLVKDLKYISTLTPDGWYDVTPLYEMNLNQDYFFPIKLIVENKVIGVGELIINDKNGWLGNIIVSKEFRNQGLGKKLTKRLIEIANANDCESIYLLATPLGKTVYQKLGFQEKGKYLFFEKGEKSIELEKNNSLANIIPYAELFKNQIFELDKKAIGEDRSKVLAMHLAQSFVYKKPHENEISGFFMPTLGDGVIICNNTIAGFEFLQKREALGKTRISLPEECTVIVDLLRKNKYTYFREATFMYLGKMKTWNPEMVYSRIGGYLG